MVYSIGHIIINFFYYTARGSCIINFKHLKIVEARNKAKYYIDKSYGMPLNVKNKMSINANNRKQISL